MVMISNIYNKGGDILSIFGECKDENTGTHEHNALIMDELAL